MVCREHPLSLLGPKFIIKSMAWSGSYTRWLLGSCSSAESTAPRPSRPYKQPPVILEERDSHHTGEVLVCSSVKKQVGV